VSSSPDDLALGYAPRRAKPFSWNRGQHAWGWCDERHRPPDPEIEALHRVGMNRAAKILAARRLNGLVRGEVLVGSNKCLLLLPIIWELSSASFLIMRSTSSAISSAV
jgi:hypothetical protein